MSLGELCMVDIYCTQTHAIKTSAMTRNNVLTFSAIICTKFHSIEEEGDV